MSCSPCNRENKRRGRHRAHLCLQYYVSGSCMTRCNCACQDIPSWWTPPTMQLDPPTLDGTS